MTPPIQEYWCSLPTQPNLFAALGGTNNCITAKIAKYRKDSQSKLHQYPSTPCLDLVESNS